MAEENTHTHITRKDRERETGVTREAGWKGKKQITKDDGAQDAPSFPAETGPTKAARFHLTQTQRGTFARPKGKEGGTVPDSATRRGAGVGEGKWVRLHGPGEGARRPEEVGGGTMTRGQGPNLTRSSRTDAKAST